MRNPVDFIIFSVSPTFLIYQLFFFKIHSEIRWNWDKTDKTPGDIFSKRKIIIWIILYPSKKTNSTYEFYFSNRLCMA